MLPWAISLCFLYYFSLMRLVMMKNHVGSKIITIYYYSCHRQTNPMLAQWTAKIDYDRSNLRKGQSLSISLQAQILKKKSVEWLTKKRRQYRFWRNWPKALTNLKGYLDILKQYCNSGFHFCVNERELLIREGNHCKCMFGIMMEC